MIFSQRQALKIIFQATSATKNNFQSDKADKRQKVFPKWQAGVRDNFKEINGKNFKATRIEQDKRFTI